MRMNNLASWEYDNSLNSLLFFSQKMDELLFHHSTDTYRYPVMSIIDLCDEYISVYKDVEKNIIAEKNLFHIRDELLTLLKEDVVAINIVSSDYKERFVKNNGSWSKKEIYENIMFMRRKLGGGTYLEKVVELLRNNIQENKEKRLIDRYAGILVRLLIDSGYSDTYIYNSLHEVFFHENVRDCTSFDNFINKFDFQGKKYAVYIGYSIDLSSLIPLFQRLKMEEVSISSIDLKKLPVGVKSKGMKTILLFENVEGLDMYSAYGIVSQISGIIVNAFGYYNHIRDGVKEYGQVRDLDNRMHTIRKQDLLKYRVSSLSYQQSQINAEKLLNVLFSTYKNISEISEITEIHNAAIYSESTSDSLLSLWSILEKISIEKDVDNITRVKESLLPFLRCTYIEKIVETCLLDIKRWNVSFLEKIVRETDSDNELEAVFSFLCLDEYDYLRNELYSLTEMYPLLRYRVYFLNAQIKNSKGLLSLVDVHTRRVEWHLHRIYRARNYIIHDGQRSDERFPELVINLHSYVDIMFNQIINLLNDSRYSRDDIENIVIEQRLKVLIMDEKMSARQKANIEKKEMKFFLYYDYEK